MSHDPAIDSLIRALIQQKKIAEQADLQTYLLERGHDIPQATLSRRLKKLKIAKVNGIYQCVELNMPHLPMVLKMEVSDFGLIVLRTHPGQANSIASFLDQKYVQSANGLLGTLAGDDTILLIVRNQAELKSMLSQLKEVFPYL